MKTTLIPLLLGLGTLQASADSVTSGITFGAFIDGYYAYDLNQAGFDRPYTTTAARHNEFGINLAYVEAKLQRDRTRGRMALQFGSSVDRNYNSEPLTLGAPNDPIAPANSLNLARHLQEAFVGYRLGPDTWLDTGIFLSHIGLESFISLGNLTYTRSFVADYSPYYETGLRLSTQFNIAFSAQFLVLNGWQNISESNTVNASAKAIGTLLGYAFSPVLSISYSTFIGQESSFRHFHDVILKYTSSDLWSVGVQADAGYQVEAPGGRDATWGGFSLMARRMMSRTVGLSGRIERYVDPDQVLVAAAKGESFKAWSASIGVDTELDQNVWWRNEFRGYRGDGLVFPTQGGFKKTDAVIVSSISATF